MPARAVKSMHPRSVPRPLRAGCSRWRRFRPDESITLQSIRLSAGAVINHGKVVVVPGIVSSIVGGATKTSGGMTVPGALKTAPGTAVPHTGDSTIVVGA